MSDQTNEQESAVSTVEDPTETAAATSPASQTPQTKRNDRKVRQGYVVSDKMDKTVVVELEDRVKHALYGKVIRRTTRVKAHDESNEVGVGDRVQIMETRPSSATKRFRVMTVLEKAK